MAQEREQTLERVHSLALQEQQQQQQQEERNGYQLY